mgnify:CR=1 FL=1
MKSTAGCPSPKGSAGRSTERGRRPGSRMPVPPHPAAAGCRRAIPSAARTTAWEPTAWIRVQRFWNRSESCNRRLRPQPAPRRGRDPAARCGDLRGLLQRAQTHRARSEHPGRSGGRQPDARALARRAGRGSTLGEPFEEFPVRPPGGGRKLRRPSGPPWFHRPSAGIRPPQRINERSLPIIMDSPDAMVSKRDSSSGWSWSHATASACSFTTTGGARYPAL